MNCAGKKKLQCSASTTLTLDKSKFISILIIFSRKTSSPPLFRSSFISHLLNLRNSLNFLISLFCHREFLILSHRKIFCKTFKRVLYFFATSRASVWDWGETEHKTQTKPHYRKSFIEMRERESKWNGKSVRIFWCILFSTEKHSDDDEIFKFKCLRDVRCVSNSECSHFTFDV